MSTTPGNGVPLTVPVQSTNKMLAVIDVVHRVTNETSVAKTKL